MYFAVFDANNFYVSCERVFNPRYQNIPTVVTSSAGGIILARSNEAKALGIPMGAPVFKIKELLRLHNVAVIPANFSKYADISARIEWILHNEFPFVEDYSIDESFVLFPIDPERIDLLTKKCGELRAKIMKWTGVPVSVGIARTKTLAKVAVKLAKKLPQGVKLLHNKAEIIQVLVDFPIADIWGVGRALSVKLPGYGITTAGQLAGANPQTLRKQFSVALAHTINELNEISCISLVNMSKPAQTTMATGTFDKELTTRNEVEQKLCEFAVRVGHHLRRSGDVATGITIFTRGNRFKKYDKGYIALQATGTFTPATNYTPTLTNFVKESLDAVFFEGAAIKRAGVYLFGILPREHRQMGLFEGDSGKIREREEKIMETIDRIEQKWGKKRRRCDLVIKV